MKVAQINTHDAGGAGLAALRLNKALIQIGVNSKLFVKHKTRDDSFIEKVESYEVHNKLFDRMSEKYFFSNIHNGNTISSVMYPSVGFEFLKEFANFDLINFHWISSFVSLEAIVKLNSMNIPLVWTLHDENPFTGGCHYTHGCLSYQNSCTACPQLEKNRWNITEVILREKIRNMPTDITIVTPSRWLADVARKSAVFRHHRIEVIPNSLEMEIFYQYDRNNVRKKLELELDSKVILFGAQELSENRKGFKYLLESIKSMKIDEEGRLLFNGCKLTVIIFGHPVTGLEDLGIDVRLMDFVYDTNRLAEIYSAADVMVLPSLEDNLPNIMLESLACGTPVVAFGVGGIAETIINGKNGYLCNPGDANGLSDAISLVLGNNGAMRGFCRDYALKHFSLSVQGSRYEELYRELLKHRGSHIHNMCEEVPKIFPSLSVPILDMVSEVSIEIEEHIIHMQREKEKLTQTVSSVINENHRLSQRCNDMTIEITNLQVQHGNIVRENEDLVIHLSKLDQLLSNERTIVVNLNKELILHREANLDASMRIEQLSKEVVWLQSEKVRLNDSLDSIFHSSSWVITSPLRLTKRFLKRVIKFWLPYALVNQIYKKRGQ